MDSAAPKPNSGEYYRHIKSGHDYVVRGVWHIKWEGRWREDGVVVYAAMDDGKQYARLTPDFLSAFELISDKQRLDPLTPEQYEQNLLHHWIIR